MVGTDLAHLDSRAPAAGRMPRNRKPTRQKLAFALSTSIALLLPGAAALRAQAIDQFSAGAGCGPWGIAAGPDDNLWLTCGSSNQVERISPGGSVLGTFTLQHPGSYPVGITTGPDGNVWFGEHDGNRIARITPAGVITEFDLPNPGSGIVGVAPGSDGNVWFTEQQGHRVGKITPTGTITEYTDTGNPGMTPGLLALGPDGNLWVDEGTNNVIAKVTPSGVFTDYTAPSATSIGGITNGADGYVWFVEDGADKIARIRASDGHIDEFGPFPGESGFGDIARGADGRIWVDEREHSKVLRLHASGVLQAVFTVANDAWNGIAGPDGNVWFINGFADAVTRVDTATGFEDFPIPCDSGGGGGGEAVDVLPDGSAIGALNLADGTHFVRFPMPDLAPQIGPAVTTTDFGSIGQCFAVDPDGIVWFGDVGANAIVRLDGTTTTLYSIPSPSAGPYCVAIGPDGNVWFTEAFEIFYGSGKVGRLVPQGGISEFPASGNPLGLTAGPDGSLWFADFQVNSVGRVTTAGAVSEFASGFAATTYGPISIASDASGLWYVGGTNEIGFMTPTGASTVVLAATSPLLTIAVDGLGSVWMPTYSNPTELVRYQPGVGAFSSYPLPWPVEAHVDPSPITGLWYGSSESTCQFGAPCCDTTHPALFGHLRREIFGDGFESGDLWRWSTRSF